MEDRNSGGVNRNDNYCHSDGSYIVGGSMIENLVTDKIVYSKMVGQLYDWIQQKEERGLEVKLDIIGEMFVGQVVKEVKE